MPCERQSLDTTLFCARSSPSTTVRCSPPWETGSPLLSRPPRRPWQRPWMPKSSCGAEGWPTPSPIRVRMGLHTGEAEFRDGDYFGIAVNRAARLTAVGHGGQVLCSAATAGLVDAEVPLIDLGEHRAAGHWAAPEGVPGGRRRVRPPTFGRERSREAAGPLQHAGRSRRRAGDPSRGAPRGPARDGCRGRGRREDAPRPGGGAARERCLCRRGVTRGARRGQQC